MVMDFCKDWFAAPAGREKEAQAVILPHDAMIAEERAFSNKGAQNIGWYEALDYVYEKTFTVPQIYAEQTVVFEFEGVYRNSEVTVNGQRAGGYEYGYTGFYVEADNYLHDGENKIRVLAKNSDQPNSRWYSGTGIYRPVSMHILPKAHILLDGIRVTTLDYAARKMKAEVVTNVPGTVSLEVLDGDQILYQETAQCDGKAVLQFCLEGAQLWDCENPKLYVLRAVFGEDTREVNFGIRTVEATSQKGFCINGKRVILRGACIHHDNGILGACAYSDAEERKVRLMKKAGYNALRSSHNPCSKATLDACDRLGVLMMDEYVDCWYIHKTKYDYASSVMDNYKADLSAMVAKDYNHPSVIMYSTGNEVAETSEEKGIKFCRAMTDFLHSQDDTRPVSCGVNIFFNFLYSMGFGVYSDEKADKEPDKEVGSAFFNKLATILGDSFMKFGATLHGSNVKTRGGFAAMDVAGYNYGIWRYKKDTKRYPNRVILGSETFCADAPLFWDIAKEYPAVIGDFVWAGIAYLGEIGFDVWQDTPNGKKLVGSPAWGARGSGRLDINGREWAEAAYTKVAFELEPIAIGVVPVNLADLKYDVDAWSLTYALGSWSWDGLEGKKTKIEVYTRAASAEVFVNGRSLGRRKVKKCRCVFPAVYEHGEVKAVAYDAAGRKIAETSLKSAGKETKLTLLPEEGTKELHFVRLQYTDNNGVLKPNEKGVIKVKVKGGTLLGLGDARQVNPHKYNMNKTDVCYGEALAVIRPDGDGPVVLEADSPHGKCSMTLPKLS